MALRKPTKVVLSLHTVLVFLMPLLLLVRDSPSVRQAISSLLKDEMDKVAAGAESERRGAMLKKFRRVERRSGGLCNPDLLEKVLRSSSTDAGPETSSPRPSSTHASPLPPPHSDPKGLGTATPASNLAVVEVEDDPEVTAAAAAATPWAEDMLCRAVRKRHAAMLRTRGRALAKGLARMLKGVSQELKGVAARLPPWEEEDPQEDDPAPQEEEVSRGGKLYSRGYLYSIYHAQDGCGAHELARRCQFLSACMAWGKRKKRPKIVTLVARFSTLGSTFFFSCSSSPRCLLSIHIFAFCILSRGMALM